MGEQRSYHILFAKRYKKVMYKSGSVQMLGCHHVHCNEQVK